MTAVHKARLSTASLVPCANKTEVLYAPMSFQSEMDETAERQWKIAASGLCFSAFSGLSLYAENFKAIQGNGCF